MNIALRGILRTGRDRAHVRWPVALVSCFLLIQACGQGKLKSPNLEAKPQSTPHSDHADQRSETNGEMKKNETQLASKAREVQDLLIRSCNSCHGENGSSSGGLKNITVLKHLIDSRYVIPGEASSSKIFMRISDGSMPPPGGIAINADEKKLIESWINEGAKISDLNDSAQRKKVNLVNDVIKGIEQDFESLTPAEKAQARYFTTWPVSNLEVSPDDVIDLEQGLAKFINSVSMSDKLSTPKKIDPSGTVYRIFLSNYGWTPERWDIATETEQLFRNHPAVEALRLSSRANVPIIRIDEFIAANAIAPKYYHLQGLQLNLNEFLRVDMKRADSLTALYNEVATRSASLSRLGFNDSQVADFSRVIERHSKSGSNVFWMSHEFATQSPEQNPFQRPLGPVQMIPSIDLASTDTGAIPDDNSLASVGFTKDSFEALTPELKQRVIKQIESQSKESDKKNQVAISSSIHADIAFRADGHEFIFEKPNGMLGFFVALSDGTRLDKAPSGVRDTTNSSAEIPVGASCMACHYEGVIPKEDEISKAFRKDTLATSARALFDYIFTPDTKSLFDSDRDRYQKSLAAIGVNHNRQDPIHRIFKSFNKSATRSEVAEILGVTNADFDTTLKSLPESVQSAWSALLVADGQIARKNVNDHLAAALTGKEENQDEVNPIPVPPRR